MKKVIGHRVLTHEEMSTFTAQVEMCLNSRPLTPFTGDTDDVSVLTPNHLLTGFALSAPPESIDEHHENIDHLTHWKLVQAMRNHFWIRWSREYLHTLQQRAKWQQPRENFEVNDLVMILDPSLLGQGKWPLGRILAVRPGRDDLVRVATVRTQRGEYVRPITKLFKLPVTQPTP